MPNLLAGREIIPEFVQDAATGPNLATAAIALLRDPVQRAEMRVELEEVILRLGPPGANVRAAKAIWKVVQLPRIPGR